MAYAAKSPLPAMVMIRPRAGDFVWTEAERDALVTEIKTVRDFGLAGVVIGASLDDGQLDAETLGYLVDAASGLDITLHRAIDLVSDVDKALSLCRDLEIKRVLTSGGAQTALAGIDRLEEMVGYDISVMPGGGVTAYNVADLAARLPLSEVHASCSVARPAPQNSKVSDFGFAPPNGRLTDIEKVVGLRQKLDAIAAQRISGWTAS